MHHGIIYRCATFPYHPLYMLHNTIRIIYTCYYASSETRNMIEYQTHHKRPIALSYRTKLHCWIFVFLCYRMEVVYFRNTFRSVGVLNCLYFNTLRAIYIYLSSTFAHSHKQSATIIALIYIYLLCNSRAGKYFTKLLLQIQLMQIM